MTPTERKRITEVFELALRLRPEERDTFVDMETKFLLFQAGQKTRHCPAAATGNSLSTASVFGFVLSNGSAASNLDGDWPFWQAPPSKESSPSSPAHSPPAKP